MAGLLGKGLQLFADELRPAATAAPRAGTATRADEHVHRDRRRLRVAVFYTKLQGRLLRPLLEADRPPAPLELRRALATISAVTEDDIKNARLGSAA